MILRFALMQPYFFPYLGYFDLIAQVDLWICFDEAQHIRRGWVNRNRVLHPTEGWQYIGVPVRKAPRETPIKCIEIANSESWKSELIRKLDHYRRMAPFFADTVGIIEESLDGSSNHLLDVNLRALRRVCRVLGLDTEIRVLSEMQVDLSGIQEPQDWALRVAEALGATEYVNPPGGRDLYAPDRFCEIGVQLTIQEFEPMMYSMGGREFVPNLSILDVLMWNSPVETRRHLTGA